MSLKVTNIPSLEGQTRIAEAVERQNQLLAAIAAGNASAEFIDNCFMQLLDGTNTTSVFWAWWPLSDNGVDTRYRRLARFGRMLANAWSDKTYTLRGYSAEVSSDSQLTPMDDLAGRSPAVLATDTAPGGEDWAEEDPMTWYIRANALSLSDGTMDVIAVEGEEGFDITGETAPVYSFALALWVKKSDDGSYELSSWRTTKAAGYAPYAGDVAPDNTKRVMTWHPSFGGGLTADGKLTSGAGKACYNFAAATGGLTAARKWDTYEGLWCDCDTEWLKGMWKLRHFYKENSGILEGCTSYNHQYKVAMAETGVTRVLLTAAQAANLVVGSTVSIGDVTTNTNLDRGQAYMHNLADKVRITSIASVTVDGTEYAAVNLDLGDGVTIDVTATTYLSTMPWHRGSTEAVPGHKDGCIGSLTNGKYPARIAGVEVLDGAYATGLDPLYDVTANSDGGYDYKVMECRDSVNLSGSITSNYKDTGIRLIGVTNAWHYIKAFVVNKLGIVIPRLLGGSSAGWYKSAFCGAGSAGVRCPWRFGYLGYGAVGGLACGNGSASPSNAYWYGSPRLSGSGKKRGEWTA